MLNSFLSGVLAVVVASPCTAPFMGAALGFAIGLPPAQAVLIFSTLGLGMALPYLVASWAPAVARVLPPPAVDGGLAQTDGLPDVRVGGVALVGAGAAKRD